MLLVGLPMRVAVPVLFLSIILALLLPRLQSVLQRRLAERPLLTFVVPAFLSALFCGIAASAGVWSAALAVLVIIYTFVPAGYAYRARNLTVRAWPDFLLILWLWLPLEFAAGAAWIPKPAQPLLHLAAYGISITLALVLFLFCRRLKGMKYNLPQGWKDFANPLIGFAVAAPALILLGRALGFIEPFHVPQTLSAARLGLEFLVILAATALPEEILFRALIQNSLMQKLGANWRTLLLAAFIFGCAHLDNGPQPLPNWRYLIVATVAGAVYGKVFQQSSSVFASAFLHALVNALKHEFF
jgi:membrane protease YdiL (CAAX protease family)